MSNENNLNRDPLTDEPGSHPIGTGLGAMAGGVAGGVAAGMVGGPVGMAIGGIAGAIAGGLAGSSAAEMVNPTLEDAYWRESYQKEPYYEGGRQYEEYRPAYAMGWTSAATYPGEFDAYDAEMQARWQNERGTSSLDWDTARTPARAAWNRVRSPATRASGMAADASLAGEQAMDNEDVVDVLNDLLETSRDGEQGFRSSAEQAQTSEIQSFLARRAGDCAKAAAELEQAVRAHGGTPADGGTMTGAMHRGWVAIKTAMMTNDDKAVLEECERGEDAAVASYRKALKHALPPGVRSLIERQAAGAQRNHDEVRAMRDRYRAAS